MSTITTTQVRQRKAAPSSSPRAKDEFCRVPTALPPFTVGDIRRAIPAHCFERSLVKSYSYVLIDAAVIAAAAYAATFIGPVLSDERFGAVGPWVRAVAWLVYWAVAGCFGTGLWVLGHECGHGGFANSALGNDVPGYILHTFLLVPYFAWKTSHRKHHSNTGNLDADEVFVPTIDNSQVAKDTLTAKDFEEPSDLSISYTFDAVKRFFNIVKMLTVGWPAYLLFNVTAHGNYPQDKWVNHFDPYSPIFSPHEAKLIFLSDMGLLAMFAGLAWACVQYGAANVWFYYGVPYLIVNLFLVLITFLQHTDLRLPHYSGAEWDWLRGALATVDRDYGWLNVVFHHITDTHVVHHLFSNMPHYHAQEATEAVKPLLGDYYFYDPTPVPIALWKIFGSCIAVKPEKANKGIYWF